MFGVVPKVLWEKTEDVDSSNRILLAMRTLVAIDRDTSRVVLVDTGAGNKWLDGEAARYAIDNDPDALSGCLDSMGMTDADVTDVVITHAHFDHCGGLTEWAGDPGGSTRVRFERARHWVHEMHWRHALSPTERDRASFLERDLEALDRSGVLEFVRGNEPPPPMDGVRWMVSNGHTPGLLLPVFEDDVHPMLFTGDLMPTSSHLRPAWIMAYDLDPLSSLNDKKKVLKLCADEGLVLAFPHDRVMGGAAIDVSGKKVGVKDVLEL